MNTAQLMRKMRTIADSYRDGITAATSYTDPEKTGAAIEEHRHAMRAEAQRQHLDAAKQLFTEVAASTKRAVDAADAAAKGLPVDTARVADEWRLAVMPLLEGGETWHSILPQLGAEGLAAVERFAPAYLRGKAGNGSLLEKREAQVNVDELMVSVQDFRWNLVADEGGAKTVHHALIAVAQEQAVKSFAESLPLARSPQDFVGIFTYLTTLEAPAFGGLFAQSLEAAAQAPEGSES